MAPKTATLVILTALAVTVTYVHGCAPSNPEDLKKIEDFLGLRPFEKGVGETKYSSTDYVSSASDLDCDFDDVSTCHWTNAETDNVTDNMDYFYFNKTLDKVWPQWDLMPGTNPPVGERMLLTGNKGTENKFAIWISSPIECQASEGMLSFNYWLYGEALMEVVLYEPDSFPLEVIVRPEQNCVRLQPVGSKCIVKIPPQENPFQIGIRAHQLKGLIGSVALIDDISYTAEELCVQKFDLGPNFNEESMTTGLTGDEIETASDLDCDGMDGCRWGNADMLGNVEWKTGSGMIDPEKWTEITGTSDLDDLPEGKFAIAKYEKNPEVSNPTAVLYSDPIPCQSGEGDVEFKYWLSEGTKLRVCTRKTTNIATSTNCQEVFAEEQPGPALVSLPPMDDEFLISFEAYDFNGGEGGLVAIDDIIYNARLCTEKELPDDEFDIGELDTQDLDDGLDGEYIEDTYDLNCEFEFGCHWGNQNPDDYQWQTGNGNLSPDKMEELTGTRELPDGSFAYIRFDGPGEGTLMSDPMLCLMGDAEVSFRYWISEGVIDLEVCAISESGEDIQCIPVDDVGSPGPGIATIKGDIQEPWRVGIRAFASDAGFAMIDDIDVIGDVCEADPPLSDDELDEIACQEISCSFDDGFVGKMCGYSSGPVGSISSEVFELRNRSIGQAANVRVGKNKKGHFLGTTLMEEGRLAILRSPEFELQKERKISLDYSRGTYGSMMYVCMNTFDSTLKTCQKLAGPGLRLGEWIGTTTDFDLDKDAKKFYIVVTHTDVNSGPASFTIDNIQMKSMSGNDMC